MKINQEIIINKNKYLIFSKCMYKEKYYYYLIDNHNNKKIITINNNVKTIKRKKLINILKPLFIENIKIHYDIL